jgi:SET domain-containing protein
MLLIETYIAESPGKEKGLFSKNFVPKGTTIWEFVEGFDIKVHKHKYNLLSQVQKDFIDMYFWKQDDYLYSSCDHSIFQNHSFTPNSIDNDKGGMMAAKDIYPNEEITTNYSQFDDDFEFYKNVLI